MGFGSLVSSQPKRSQQGLCCRGRGLTGSSLAGNDHASFCESHDQQLTCYKLQGPHEQDRGELSVFGFK